jgi:hypothetical protein
MCVLTSLQRMCETFLILKIVWRDIVINEHGSYCKVPVRYQWDFNFLSRFPKNTQMPNFTKILPVRAEFFMDWRTDRHNEAYSCFSCNFATAPENARYTFKFLVTLMMYEIAAHLIRYTVSWGKWGIAAHILKPFDA